MNRLVLLVVVLLGSPAYAQSGPQYQAPTAPLYWVSDNPFHLHLIRAGDTIGDPVRAISIFKESWRAVPTGFDVERASSDLGFSTRSRTDTISVDARGTVLKINGQLDYNQGEWDALLRLPPEPLAVGLEWTDTLRHPTGGPTPGLYEVGRSYHVTRKLASADSSGFEIAIRGTIRFNLSMWTDSLAGQYRWFELEGPVEELFVFDSSTGQLHRRTWSMLLQGIGGDHNGATSDTVPAALRSENRRFRIPEARARALTSNLPGSDTSVTISGEDLLFAHTLGGEAGRLSEGFRGPDGVVARADVVVGDQGPEAWEFSWVSPSADERKLTLSRNNEFLQIGARRVDAPTSLWGVAEHNMLGTLAPSLQQMPEAQGADFAVYRPTADKWDVFRVTKRNVADVTIYILVGGSGEQSALLVDREGLLLFGETVGSTAAPTMRVPTTQARTTQLERLLTQLRGGI